MLEDQHSWNCSLNIEPSTEADSTEVYSTLSAARHKGGHPLFWLYLSEKCSQLLLPQMSFFKRWEFGDLEKLTFKTRKTKSQHFPSFFLSGNKRKQRHFWYQKQHHDTSKTRQRKWNWHIVLNSIKEWSLQNCILKGPSKTGLDVIDSHHPSASPKKLLYKEMEPVSDAGNWKPMSSRKPALWGARCCSRRCRRYPLCVCVSRCTKQVTHF